MCTWSRSTYMDKMPYYIDVWSNCTVSWTLQRMSSFLTTDKYFTSITLVVRSDFQGLALALCKTLGAVEQVLQPGPDVGPHGLVVALQLAPLFLFLQDDTVEQPQALPQSRMQQLHRLLTAGLLRVWGQGHDAPAVWGVVQQEGLPLFLQRMGKSNTWLWMLAAIRGLTGLALVTSLFDIDHLQI